LLVPDEAQEASYFAASARIASLSMRVLMAINYNRTNAEHLL